MSADASRDRMIAELKTGAGGGGTGGSHKHLLIRGCDPVMAKRAGEFLPKMLDDAKLTSATDDDTFLKLLRDTNTKYDVVVFAPGAMRWDAAGSFCCRSQTMYTEFLILFLSISIR